jgi:hypothetical protein
VLVVFLIASILFLTFLDPHESAAQDFVTECDFTTGYDNYEEAYRLEAINRENMLAGWGSCDPYAACHRCGYLPDLDKWEYCLTCCITATCTNSAFPYCGGSCSAGYTCQATETACACVPNAPACTTTAPTGLSAAKMNGTVSNYVFYWTNGAASNRHILKICKNSDMTNCRDDVIQATPPPIVGGQGYATSPIPLDAGTYYYWSVTNDGPVCDKTTKGTPFLSSCELSVSSLTIPLGQHASLQTMLSSETPTSGLPSVITGVRYTPLSLCYPQCAAYSSSVQCNGYPYRTWHDTSTWTGSDPRCTNSAH